MNKKLKFLEDQALEGISGGEFCTGGGPVFLVIEDGTIRTCVIPSGFQLDKIVGNGKVALYRREENVEPV